MAKNKEEARAILWKKGLITSWKLHSVQKEIYDNIKAQTDNIITVLCSRRLGKSYLACLMAIEQCLQKEHSIVKFVSPRQKQVKTNIRPIMNRLLKDCPPELKPEFKTNDNIYLFPNGSEIQLAGTDNGNHENLRGGAADLCVVDEAGFCDELGYVVNSILSPTTDTTGGKIILVSTPSKESDHEFIIEYVQPAEFKGKLIKKTIYDNPMLSEEQVTKIISRYEKSGGINSTEFQREYMCRIVVESSMAVIPEFTEELEKKIVKEMPIPPYYDMYVSMDIGMSDLTFVVFAYYDFKNDIIVVRDELVMNGPEMTTDKLAIEVTKKEKENFFDIYTLEPKVPYMRVADNNNLVLLNDLLRLHNLQFYATAKDNSDAALNNMRMYLAGGKIIIDPKCKTLIRHLRGATWNKSRNSYKRSPDNGHYDGVDALKYLVRNVQFGKNPYPYNYGWGHGDDWFVSPHHKKPNDFEGFLKDLFQTKLTNKNRS